MMRSRIQNGWSRSEIARGMVGVSPAATRWLEGSPKSFPWTFTFLAAPLLRQLCCRVFWRCSNGWTPALLRPDLSSALRGSRGRQLRLAGGPDLWLGDMLPEPDAAAPGRTLNSRIDQLDPRVLKRGNQLHQGIDVGPDDAVTGFHALNRRNRKVCQIGHLPLIDVQQRARGPELIGSNHENALLPIAVKYIYTA